MNPLLATGAAPNVGWITPFVLLLACIALLPLIPATAHWWHSNRSKLIVAVALALSTLGYYFFAHGYHGGEPGRESVLALLHHAVLLDYVPFLAMLFSLYTIAGGIELTGDLPPRPLVNTVLIATGTVIASLVGTTGAAMLLVRPLLRANARRTHVVHTVVFFIFAVCNCGGLLLPIGDPPLFLGYLRGVPFLWTTHFVPEWLTVNGAILVVYYVWERLAFRREPKGAVAPIADKKPIGMQGERNLVLLGVVVASVALLVPGRPFLGTSWSPPPFLREVVMLACAWASYKPAWFTPKGLRERVHFDFFAITEVACLFIGIFVTMQVPLELLNDPATVEKLGVDSPASFYWAAGILSSVLDNAPTYIVFFESAKALDPLGAMLALPEGSICVERLIAISCGSVMFGALTYIGNGPNFLVKALAEQAGVKMPSFIGYLGYSLLVLLPVFALVSVIYFN